jgi:type VI secretion system protein ImpL
VISDHLTTLSYFFPWSLIIALILAIIFAVIGVMIFRHTTKKTEEEPQPKKPHPFLEKGRLYFARYGYFSTDPLSQSFVNALKLMHSFIGGRKFRYQLPWIVMFGTEGAGKSTILHSLDLDMPIGRPHFASDEESTPLCDWWFYDHGIVLDVDGKMVLNASQTVSDEDHWTLFLNLLTHYRPKRPLDGVILSIPASELIGEGNLSHDDIMLRAEHLYDKLWQMQRLTGLRIPIYVVVTKCDLVPGFISFCKSIPAHNRRDIFGWSNDKAIDSIYTSEWVEEAFSSINQSLYRVQEEVYADGQIIDGRDGVFMLPVAFNQLKGGIRTYTDHLFKLSSYHESFFLRGIYFTGDSFIEEPLSESVAPSKLLLKVPETKLKDKRSLYFIDNLFENKVFREAGLARPVSRALLGSTSVMRFLKIIVFLAVILGTLGLLGSNKQLQNAKLNLVPALTQVEVTLEKIHGQNIGTDIGRVFFDDQTQVLLNTMTQISVNQLSSIFIPASWFSSLDTRIGYVMSLAYDQVILKSMASQLAYKAEQLVSLNTTIPITEPIGKGIDPLETPGFYHLKSFVVSIRALELAADKFNQLGMTSSLKDVADIIKYLFNYDMPEGFYTDDSYYIDAFKETNVKIFDFESYRNNASIKLHKLFDEFQNSAFDPNKMIPGLARLMTNLYQFSGARNYTAYDADLLREVYTSLQETIASILNPGLQWLDTDRFDPGPQYEYIMGLIVGSTFFSEDTVSILIREIDQNFINFRKRLATYTSPLFQGGHLFLVDEGMALSEPSRGALDLKDSLTVFFNEAFMNSAEKKTIITAVPIGSVLLWDTLRLQQGVSLISIYNNFMNSRLLNMPKILQPMLQKVGSESLIKNLVQFIADAEVFSAQTAAGTPSSPEDSLLTQVQNYRASDPYLEQLLFALKAHNANSAFSTLKSLVTDQNYKPLKRLDSILTEEYPYGIKMNSFDWWNGENLAALEAFGVTNLTELKNYLELQRSRINYLAREFGEPLVSFLENINKEGMPGNLPLVTKWEGIIRELNGYDQKTPANGLAELEHYIMNPLNEVTLATCSKYANSENAMSLRNDFFVSILIGLQEKLMKQCKLLSGYVSTDHYSQLSQFFNANLAGKFPFVEKADDIAPDANPDDIRTFFEMLDTQASGIKSILQQAQSLGAAGKNALTFIEQMEGIRKFFGGYLVPNSTIPSPAFSFDVTFRVNESRENRANEILDWEMKVQDTTITMRSPSHKGYWTSGNPMSMVFQWAANSPLQPQDGNAPGFDVQGECATFSYGGTWGFLRLLRQHHAKPSDFDNLNDEQPITLRFDIPLTNTVSNDVDTCANDPLRATVFVRVEVSPVAMTQVKKASAPSQNTPQAADQGKIQMGQPVNLPFFPYNAPQLNNTGI